MMLYIVSAYKPRTIFTPSAFPMNSYNFFWRTGGGRTCQIITDKPDVIIEVLRNKYQFNVTEDHIKEMPKNPDEFFEILSKFIELKWRKLQDHIEVSVVAVGKFIGTGHRNIKAIEEHLGCKVKVTPAIKVINDRTLELYRTENYETVEFDSNYIVATKLNPSYGYSPDIIWIAPWGIIRRQKIDDEIIWNKKILPLFRIPLSNIEVHAICKPYTLNEELLKRFKDKLYVKKLRQSEWLIVRKPENNELLCTNKVAPHVIGKKGQRIKEISKYFGMHLKVKVV